MSGDHSTAAGAVAELLVRSTNSPEVMDADSGPWEAFVGGGFPWAAVPEERGGPGGTVSDAVEIVREVGRAGAAVPAGETDLLGDWLLRQATLPAVTGLLTVAQGNKSDDLRLIRDGSKLVLTGGATGVAWASRSSFVVALVSDQITNHVVCVPTERLSIVRCESLAGEERDTIAADAFALTADQVGPAAQLDILSLRARGAATRALLIQGAVAAVVDMTTTYCSVREQFGRRIRDFQAVGHQLALMRERATLVDAAAGLAAAALEGTGSWEFAATAKIVAGEVAGQIATAAHQLHGAIGVSEEYPLHRYTRRLWAWRDEYGGEHEWAGRLGPALADRGPEGLWPWITSPDQLPV